MTAWTYKKEGENMTSDEIMKMREELTPLNRLKFDMFFYELLDEENKLTSEELVEFAKSYQIRTSELSLSYEDLAIFGSFFEKYGEKFGVLDKFHENGIC